MTRDGPNAKLRLTLSPDATVAELIVPADMAPEEVNTDAAAALLFEAGITIDDDARDAVGGVIDAWSSGTEAVGVVARGQSAKHGANGRIDWNPDVLSPSERLELDDSEGCSPDAADRSGADKPDPPTDGHDDDGCSEPVSFYDRCAFVMIKEGQQLGRVVPPEEGEDGVDVTGKVLPAKAGRAPKIRVDESILIDANGVLLAQRDGVLSRTLDKASVRNLLEIPGAVDFSTGNIDFDGDVKIQNGVRDLFEVTATGNIDIRGLVESAVIETTGDLVSAGGMAGRDRGKIRTGGDLTIRYIDSTLVHVGGNLLIERETINCEVLVHGKVDSPRASIIGGRLVSIGPIDVSTIGSDACTPTDVVVGSVPPLEDRLVKLDRLISKLERDRDKADEEMKAFSIPGRARTTEDAERQTELSFSLTTLNDQLGKCQELRNEVIDRVNELRVVDLRVQRTIHTGVTICCGVQRITLDRELKGPVRILRDRRGELCYRTGDSGANMPLRQSGSIQAAAA